MVDDEDSARAARAPAAWPSGAAWCYAGALGSSGRRAMRLDHARSELDALAACEENHWLGREVLEGGAGGARAGVEVAVCEVWRRVVRRFLEERGDGGRLEGCEFWSQCYEENRGLAFHFDKDEQLLAATGEMSHPMYSSVLYLHCGDGGERPAGGDGEEPDGEVCLSSSRLGATIVMDQRHAGAQGGEDDDVSRRDVLVWPAFNSLLIFDGGLAHGVLESSLVGGPQRKTLLMNWWCRRPLGVERLGDARAAGLSTYEGDIGGPGGDDGDDAARRVEIVSVDVDVDEPTRLEAVLASHFEAEGMGRLASTSVDAVAFSHPNAQLYHVEEPAGAVYFVPDHCLG